MIYLQEKLSARDSVVRSVVELSCATLGLSFRDLVNIFRAGLNKAVGETFRSGSLDFQFPANTAVDDITLRYLRDAALEDSRSSTKGEDVFDRPVDPKVSKL